MEFIQPSDEIVTAKTEAENQKLTQIRNNISLLEAETKRLRGLIDAEKYEIEQLVNSKSELTALIPILQAERDFTNDEIASLTLNLSLLKEAEKEAKISRDKALEEADKCQAKCLQATNDINIDREQINTEKKDLEERSKLIEQQSIELKEKFTQLKEIIS